MGHTDRSFLKRELGQREPTLLNRTVGHRGRPLLISKLSKWIENASTAHWVTRTDLYPSAACLNRHDTDRAAGESPKHGKLSRRGKMGHNGFVVDGTGLAAANLT